MLKPLFGNFNKVPLIYCQRLEKIKKLEMNTNKLVSLTILLAAVMAVDIEKELPVKYFYETR
jgi:hypothetical protein